MFEHLASYPRIAVTGPQRSGTRITAKMVAQDTGHTFVDETEFGVFDEVAWTATWRNKSNVVVQCPHMLKSIVDRRDGDLFVILVRRDLRDIHRSEARIGWNERKGGLIELRRFDLDDGDPAAVKYDYWDSEEKVPYFLEVEYSSLREHPLYVPKGLRAGFRPKQTAVEPPGR